MNEPNIARERSIGASADFRHYFTCILSSVVVIEATIVYWEFFQPAVVRAYFPVVMNLHALLIGTGAVILSVIATILTRVTSFPRSRFIIALFISALLGVIFIFYAHGFLYGFNRSLIRIAAVLVALLCFLCLSIKRKRISARSDRVAFIVAISLWLFLIGVFPWILSVLIPVSQLP